MRKGPRLLAVFGAGGTETLVWAYLLATKEFELLKRAATSDKEMVVIGQFAVPHTDVNRCAPKKLCPAIFSAQCNIYEEDQDSHSARDFAGRVTMLHTGWLI
jgi:hypothetical protein